MVCLRMKLAVEILIVSYGSNPFFQIAKLTGLANGDGFVGNGLVKNIAAGCTKLINGKHVV